MAATHELKILPEYFAAVISGDKRFEIRKNDRAFMCGDTLVLREWDSQKYSGRQVQVRITYATDFAQREGYLVLGITAPEHIEHV